MTLRTNRAGRCRVSLSLESLETRDLLNATLPTPAPNPFQTAAQHSAAPGIGINYAASAASVKPAAAVASVSYSYSSAVSPGRVLVGTNSTTHNGKSTGSVAIALYRGGSATTPLGGSATSLPVALVTTSSSASTAHPDRFNVAFSISLRLRDSTSGASAMLTFKGTISGTLTYSRSSLSMTFQSARIQKVRLGSRVYTVTLPTSLRVPAQGTTPAQLKATIQVSKA